MALVDRRPWFGVGAFGRTCTATAKETDFYNEGERNGLAKFLNIMYRMKNFTTVQFGWDDIVRSDIVRDYIMTKEMLGIH